MICRSALVAVSLLATSGVADANLTAGPSQQTAAQLHHSWLAPNANSKHTWMYVASLPDNVVAIYELDRFTTRKIGAIKEGIKGPFGVVVDAQGTVYVANSKAGTVTIYPAGTVSPGLTISSGLQSPVGLAVDTNGDVYVGNQGSAPSVQVYAQGQTTPYRTITSALIVHPGPLTFDDARDCVYRGQLNGSGGTSIWVARPSIVGAARHHLSKRNRSRPGHGRHVCLRPESTGNVRLSARRNFADPNHQERLRRFLHHWACGEQSYLFGPCSACNAVNIFKLGGKKPWASLNTVTFPQGVAIKPAGVP